MFKLLTSIMSHNMKKDHQKLILIQQGEGGGESKENVCKMCCP
jgi:hypothetical protein